MVVYGRLSLLPSTGAPAEEELPGSWHLRRSGYALVFGSALLVLRAQGSSFIDLLELSLLGCGGVQGDALGAQLDWSGDCESGPHCAAPPHRVRSSTSLSVCDPCRFDLAMVWCLSLHGPFSRRLPGPLRVDAFVME